MEQRKIVDEHLQFKIGINTVDTYKKNITWKDVLETKGVLPDDIIDNIFYKEERETGMFSLKMEDELEMLYIPTLEVIRKRPETDEEFLHRKQGEQKVKNDTEKRERLEYLRLKAKFETPANPNF